MKSDKFIKVKKSDLETSVPEHAVKRYLDNGWKVVEEKKEKPKTYDNYNVKQLKDIAKNRNIYINSRMKKSEIIEHLIQHDNQNASKPSNKGFTDNLIIE